MEYLFVHDKDYGGWWLKIDNVDQLIDYHQKTSIAILLINANSRCVEPPFAIIRTYCF